MAKVKSYYLCRACGSMQSKWLGKCPDCDAWDTLEEMAAPTADLHKPKVLTAGRGGVGGVKQSAAAGAALVLSEIPPLEVPRIPTTLSEFDRVLGGGVVPGSAILLGGEPGIGKSTLLLQSMAALAQQDVPVLYVTSEESAQQTQLRARRLGLGESPLKVLAETNLQQITATIQSLRPAVVVIDSIQMIYQPENAGAPGSVSQLRDCCTELVYLAKASGCATILVGHVTKEGTLAGPKLVEHIVDTVLYFEGDSHHDHRVVRAAKNRFGNTLEIGLFRMTGAGLESIDDSATLLLEAHAEARAGSVITAALQGSRVLLVEVQALTADAGLGNAKRKVSGCDAARVAMIIAVLEKHGGLRLVDRDIFVNVVGGIRLVDPSADVAIALAIAGAHMNRALPRKAIVMGELGLLGELRPVAQIGQRINEAARLGFGTALVPKMGRQEKAGGIEVRPCGTLQKAMDYLG